MEEINFYHVEIGTETRRGNFLKNHSFVCKSAMNRRKLSDHYRDKYDGFCVKISDIKDVAILDSPKEESETVAKPTKKVNSFTGKLEFDSFSKTTRNRLIELYSARKDCNALSRLIQEDVINEITNKSDLIKEVRLPKDIPEGFNGRTSQTLEYLAVLSGDIQNQIENCDNNEDEDGPN